MYIVAVAREERKSAKARAPMRIAFNAARHAENGILACVAALRDGARTLERSAQSHALPTGQVDLSKLVVHEAVTADVVRYVARRGREVDVKVDSTFRGMVYNTNVDESHRMRCLRVRTLATEVVVQEVRE